MFNTVSQCFWRCLGQSTLQDFKIIICRYFCILPLILPVFSSLQNINFSEKRLITLLTQTHLPHFNLINTSNIAFIKYFKRGEILTPTVAECWIYFSASRMKCRIMLPIYAYWHSELWLSMVRVCVFLFAMQSWSRKIEYLTMKTCSYIYSLKHYLTPARACACVWASCMPSIIIS